jgi:diguanylate cyclase (GGDEF)-like protein
LKKILIVEDNGILSKALKKTLILEMPDFDVHIAETEKEAMRIVATESEEIFIVFLDLHLPDTKEVGNIVDFMRRFKLRVVVLTGSEDVKLREKVSNKLNVVDYVIKDNLTNIQYVTQLAKWIYQNKSSNREALVVDDAKLPRKLSQVILTLLGFKTLEAVDGEDAFKQISENRNISLVVTDLEMPKMTGVELTSMIRKNIHRPIVIIGVTGSSDQLEVIKFLKYGANDYIRKPLSKEEFINRIRKDMFILEQTLDLQNRINTISEQKEKIEKLATTDSLTQLFNRHKFQELFEKQIEENRKSGEVFSVIIFDIDKFKNINDSYGHDVGDSVLIEISQLIKEKVRENDIVARWGGEEFVVLLPKTGIARAVGIAEKLRRNVEQFNFKHVNRVTISLGVSRHNKGDTVEKLLKRVDELLYKAKHGGRNRVEHS